MNQTTTPQVREPSLETMARRFETFCESHTPVLLLGGSVIYLLAMLVQSSLKPLWYDEVFTHMLANLPAARLWQALKAGAEVHPPLAILLVHVAQRLFGQSAWAARLPSILAFLGLVLSVFFVVRRELSAVWGFAAVWLLFLTRAEFYATEARPYAILMCCAAISLLCWQRWQRTISGGRRWLYLAGIALSVATATSAHFFGLLIPFPIALGELYRTWQRRRIDFAFWVATLAGMSVIFVYLPIMRTTHRYIAHNINPSHARLLPQLYEQPLGSLTIIVLLVLAALWLQFGWKKFSLTRSLRPTEVAAAGFCLLPLFQLVLGHFTNSMNPRYTESLVIGGAMLFVFGAAWAFGPPQAAGFTCFVMIGLALLSSSISQYRVLRAIPHGGPKLDVQGLPDLPIVVDQALLYLQVQYYNPELRERLYFVASPEDSIRTIDSDTLDLNLISERGWLPLNIADKNQFFHKGSHFLLFASTNSQVWLQTWELDKVKEMGGEARELKRIGTNDYYFDVTIPD